MPDTKTSGAIERLYELIEHIASWGLRA